MAEPSAFLLQPKYYSSDNGLIYAIGLNFSENLGRKYETAALLKIYHETEIIAYWSGKNEVDFIFDKKAVNVTIGNFVPERETFGLTEFKKHHPRFELIIVSKDISADGEIKIIPFQKFQP